jgi:hypothetical protein
VESAATTARGYSYSASSPNEGSQRIKRLLSEGRSEAMKTVASSRMVSV